MFRVCNTFFYCRRLCSLSSIARPSSNLNTVKVLSTEEDDFLKITFRYGNFPHTHNVNLKASKNQRVGEILNQIKQMVNLHRHRCKMREAVVNKYSGQSTGYVYDGDYDEASFEVNLINGEENPDHNVANVKAWTQGAMLKIGESLYEVNHNTPAVVSLTLPQYMLSGCFIRPRFQLECANLADCKFTWYRSAEPVIDAAEIPEEWKAVGEGFIYETSAEDTGCKLKVECLPKLGDNCGVVYSTVSDSIVEACPNFFPFQERHLYTKNFVDSDCIRCVTYNILANCYVEQKKFPYCSKKARDGYYRRQLLFKELLGYNTDILCLQEVQERSFENDFQDILTKADFEGFHITKGGGRRFEGTAVYYRNTKFKVIEEQGVHLNQIVKNKEIFTDFLRKVSGNYKVLSDLIAQFTALQLVLLQHVENPKYRVLVANTHLYSNKDKPEVRLLQSVLCTGYIEHYLRKRQDPSSTTALIFCGDFNSLPDSAAYEFLKNGSFECSSTWKNSSSTEETDAILSHNLRLQSACGTPDYTNYTEEFSGCLDYIFHSEDSLSVVEVVPMCKHEDIISEVALPSEHFPSDHLPLVCTLKWNDWRN